MAGPQVSVLSVARFSARTVEGERMAWTVPIRHDVWAIDYCSFAGMHVRVEADGLRLGPVPRAPGTWHLYAPGTTYFEAADRPAAVVEKRWVLFRLAGDCPPLTGRPLTAVFDPDEVLLPLHTRMHALGVGGLGEALAVDGLMTAIVAHLVAGCRGEGDGLGRPFRLHPPGAATRRPPSLAERVDALVRARLRRPPSLAELARTLAMSPSSLSHRFKAEAGMGVIARCRLLRVEAARGLLLRPEA